MTQTFVDAFFLRRKLLHDMHLYVPSHALLENMFSDLQLIIAGTYMSLRGRCFLKQASGDGDTELAINILRICV